MFAVIASFSIDYLILKSSMTNAKIKLNKQTKKLRMELAQQRGVATHTIIASNFSKRPKGINGAF